MKKNNNKCVVCKGKKQGKCNSTATNPTNLNDATSMDVKLEDINSGTGHTASRATSTSSNPPSIRTNLTNLNDTTSMDVEPEDVDSGSGAASSSSYQPSISTTNPKSSTNCCTIAITKHPLNTTTLPSPALLIVHSQGFSTSIPVVLPTDQFASSYTTPFTFHTPQTVISMTNTLPHQSGLASDTTSFQFSIPLATPSFLLPFTRFYSASRK